MKNKVQLITYPDSLGGDLRTLNSLLNTDLKGLFPGGVHILPPFPSSGDRGFAPTTYRQIEPAFGSWEDMRAITQTHDVMLDIMVNHISRFSDYFQDFLQHGRSSKYADMFITLDKIWPGGEPPEEDVQKIFLRKPEHPFLEVQIQNTGETERIWASFGPRVDYSEQIDLDIHSPVTRQFFAELFNFLNQQGIKMIRLDAIGYVIKKPGTSCFMVEPEVYQFLDWLTEIGAKESLQLLPEVHTHYTTQFKLAAQGFWVYDFVLPMLILHTLETGDSNKLADYLQVCPRKQVTMLDCHDGIPVQPDVDDILSLEESKYIVERCLERGANLNRILSKTKENGFDAHQINITYYDALERNDDAYISARAIQFFCPGVPQVYYVGLLAGENHYYGVEASGEGRAINRKNYADHEVIQDLKKPVVQRLIKLIRFRNQHPAFGGSLTEIVTGEHQLTLRWDHEDDFSILSVDLNTLKCTITHSTSSGETALYEV